MGEENQTAALVALAYIGNEKAVCEILKTASSSQGLIKAQSVWWLLTRMQGEWSTYKVKEALKKRNIYDSEDADIIEIISEEQPKQLFPNLAEIKNLQGDVQKGELTITSCLPCHKINSEGVDFGPDILNFYASQSRIAFINAILNPSGEISLGYEGSRIHLKDGKIIDGRLLSTSNPIIIQSRGGITQIVGKDLVKKIEGLRRSLMPSATQLGLSAQDIKNIIAYLDNIN